MEPINAVVICITIASIFYILVINHIKRLENKLNKIIYEINKANDNLDKILKLQSSIGDDLSDIGEGIYNVSCNAELMSSMNVAAYIANTNETIRQLIKHDKFEAAQMLKKNVENLLRDYKKINPKCNLEIKDVNELTRDIFGDDED